MRDDDVAFGPKVCNAAMMLLGRCVKVKPGTQNAMSGIEPADMAGSAGKVSGRWVNNFAESFDG